MVIDGAFEAWPRTRRLPRPQRIRVAVGAPVMPPQYEGADAAAVMAEVRRRMVELQAELRGKPARRGVGEWHGAQ
jgi:1-acyl-sn-glycerol-3-phosphate acyltransferase